jgi:hypothetical protein
MMASDFAEHAHARSVEEVAAHFGVSLEDGLDASAVARQRAKHGRNELPVDEGEGLALLGRARARSRLSSLYVSCWRSNPEQESGGIQLLKRVAYEPRLWRRAPKASRRSGSTRARWALCRNRSQRP